MKSLNTTQVLAERIFVRITSFATPADDLNEMARIAYKAAEAFESVTAEREKADRDADGARVCKCGHTKDFHTYGPKKVGKCDDCSHCTGWEEDYSK